MKESVLQSFFLVEISEKALAIDLKGSQQKASFDTKTISILSQKDGEFKVTNKHLIKLCDAFLKGSISSVDLSTVGFALEFSDFFTWDATSRSGKIIDEVIHDWANESIGYDITIKNVWHWKNYLLTGFYNLDKTELKLKFRNNGKYLPLYRTIDLILEKEWDPIGVSDSARDEYQSYVPQIFQLKKSNSSVHMIENTLLKIETEKMGLNGNRENCKRVSLLINALI